MKKFVAFLLTALIICAFGTTAFAADPPKPPVPTVGTPASGNVGSASGHKLLPLAAASASASITVIDWRNSIEEVSSAYLKLYGATTTDQIADRVDVNFTLQQWNGSSWVTYSTSNNNNANVSFYSPTIYRFVAHGYYYRVKTVHNGYLGSSSDSETIYSSYIWVS